MKYNCFISTIKIVFIANFITWFIWIATKFRQRHQQRQQLQQQPNRNHNKQNMYHFRPFEVINCDYKSYSKTSKGRGINIIPKARSGHRVAANEVDLFSFGGYNPDTDETLFQEMLKFNFITQKWSKVFSSKTAKMPKETVSNALTLRDNCLVLFGGTGHPFGRKRSNETYIMWPYGSRPYGSREIERIQTRGDKPDELYGQAILLRDHYLYVIGGTSGHVFLCDIHRLNLRTRTWEIMYVSNDHMRDDDPPGRYRHEIAHDDDNIYIFGGGTQGISFELDQIPAYSLTENRFRYIKTKPDSQVTANGGYPEARRFHSCTQQIGDNGIDVIIAGGFKAPNVYLDDIWKFNLRTYQWTLYKQTKLPYKLYFHDAASTGNGLMYIFGGVSGRAENRTNDLHKMWVQIPALSEICWDAITYYHPTISSRSKEDLLRVGIPLKFAERATFGRNLGTII